MKEIPLTQGKAALVDDEDYSIVSQFKWAAMWNGSQYYATAGKPRRRLYLHRLIMNPPPGIMIDHIDGNGLNCQRGNMRFATQAQNQCNRGKPSNNKSGYKGVSWSKARGKWYAQIQFVGHRIHIGQFSTAEDAAFAYDKRARELFGEFAKTNF